MPNEVHRLVGDAGQGGSGALASEADRKRWADWMRREWHTFTLYCKRCDAQNEFTGSVKRTPWTWLRYRRSEDRTPYRFFGRCIVCKAQHLQPDWDSSAGRPKPETT